MSIGRADTSSRFSFCIEVLEDPLPWLKDIVRARKPRSLPVALTRDEVRAVLGEMSGLPRLFSSLLYGNRNATAGGIAGSREGSRLHGADGHRA
jgi:hypothetical protein